MGDVWDDKPTVIRKNHAGGAARSNAAINQAMASGANIDIRKKAAPTAGSNKQHAGPSVNMAKIDAATDEFKVKTVDKSVSKAIIDGRQKKGLNQKDFATAINEKVQIVQEYETGKAVPNQVILGKMERALGVKLRGTGVGQPL